MDRALHQRRRMSRGCSLVELLIATTGLLVALAAAAQVFALATHATYRAKQTTFATVLAQQKMEQLVGAAASTAGIGRSPAGALDADIDGYSDIVDGYRRRWSIEPMPSTPAGVLVVQVVVTPGGAHLATLRRKAR